MNWDKAKNIIITFLLLLNILLGFMLYQEYNRYSLSQESERAIYTVLAQNKIGMYAQMVKKSRPMRPLDIQQFEYTLEDLEKWFFPGDNDVKRTVEFNKTLLKRGDEKILTLQNGYISYENQYGLLEEGQGMIQNEEAAQALCDRFLQKWGKEFKDFKKDRTELTSKGWVFDYCQNYRGAVIYSNFFTFTVTEKGIEKIICRYSRPLGYENNAREIYFADQVIFTLINELKNMYGDTDTGLLINQMDLVYFQEENSTSKDSPLKAVPYYRFYIEGKEQTFLINAYTNVYNQATR